MSDEREYHYKVLRLATKLHTFLNEQTDPFDIKVNALLTVLAMAGFSSDLERDEFCTIMAVQLDDLMARMGDKPEFLN
jgi:hypothetical protein